MKKLLTICFLVFATQLFAQTENVESIPKGTKFIGGSLSVNSTIGGTNFPNADDSKTKASSFSIGPVAGKYIRDNVSIGLGVSYNYSHNKGEYPDGAENESSFNSAGTYFFIRKNYKIVPNFFFFLQAHTGFSYGASKNIDTNDNEYKSSNLAANLGGSPGFQVFLGKKFSLETTLGNISYQFSHTEYEDSDIYTNTHGLNLSGGLDGISFSVRYFIFQ